MLRSKLGFFVAAVAMAAAAQACGGSDDGGSGGSSGSGGSGGSSGSGGGGPDEEIPGAQPPADPGAGAPSGDELVLAVDKLFLGDTDRSGNDDPQGWKNFGFNLDGIASTKTGTNHCSPVQGANPANVKTDGNEGIDNSFGSNLLPLLNSAANASDAIDEAINEGSFTIMMKFDSIDAASDASGIMTSLYGGGDLGAPPAFDGTDEWPVLYELLNNGDINSPKVTFPNSYITGGTWVSGGKGTIDLTLAISGFNLTLSIVNAQIALDLMGGSPAKATNGTIAGVLDTEDLVEQLRAVAGALDESLCEGSAFDNIAQQIRAASDIMADGSNGDPDQTCDAISVGLGFSATQVTLGGVTDPAEPGEDPCMTGGM